MAKDASGMGTFWGTYPGFDTVKVNPPDNQQDDIEDAFDDTSDNDDVVVYIILLDTVVSMHLESLMYQVVARKLQKMNYATWPLRTLVQHING